MYAIADHCYDRGESQLSQKFLILFFIYVLYILKLYLYIIILFILNIVQIFIVSPILFIYICCLKNKIKIKLMDIGQEIIRFCH